MSTGNTKFGTGALANNNTTDGISSAFGYNALNQSTAKWNTAVGASSGASTTTGISNTSVGANTLLENISGSYNTALGTAACLSTSGSSNTAVGSNTLQNNTTGEFNTAIGAGAAYINSGTKNTFLGAETDSSSNSHSESTAIGYGAQITGDNQITMGTSTETVYIPGQLTVIGAITGTANLATNLAGGGASRIPYQSAVSVTSFIQNGSSGEILTSNGSIIPPTWETGFAGTAANALTAVAAGTATNLVGGAQYSIPYQSGIDTTDFITNGISGKILTSDGISGEPYWSDTFAGNAATATTAATAAIALTAGFASDSTNVPRAITFSDVLGTGPSELFYASTSVNNCFINPFTGQFVANSVLVSNGIVVNSGIVVTNGIIETPTDLCLETSTNSSSVLLQPNGVTTLEANSSAIVHKKNTTLPVGESAPVEKLQLGGRTSVNSGLQVTLSLGITNLLNSGVLPAGTYLFIGQANFECIISGIVTFMGSSFYTSASGFPSLTDELGVSMSSITSDQSFSVTAESSCFSSSCVVQVITPTTYYFNVKLAGAGTFNSSGIATFTRIA